MKFHKNKKHDAFTYVHAWYHYIRTKYRDLSRIKSHRSVGMLEYRNKERHFAVRTA